MANRVNATVTLRNEAGRPLSRTAGSGSEAEVWADDINVKVITYTDDNGEEYTVVDVTAAENAVVIINDVDAYREGMYV